MLFNRKKPDLARPEIHVWKEPPPLSWQDTKATVEAVAQLWRDFDPARVDGRVSEHDDMIGTWPGAYEAYTTVGLSALRIVTEAMMLTGRTAFPRILDLPCGGGRVTRYLSAFFPDSEISVGDIEAEKQAAVCAQFGARPFPFKSDFTDVPSEHFDLIFVGSLLTHFDEGLFKRALGFFIDVLAPEGIAAITLHGRYNASDTLYGPGHRDLEAAQRAFAEHAAEVFRGRRMRTNFDPSVAVEERYRRTGFGYFETPQHTQLYRQSYGGSFSAGSWVLPLVEARADCMVVGYKERAYDHAQDVLLLRKLRD